MKTVFQPTRLGLRMSNRDELGDSICSLLEQVRAGCEKSRSSLLSQLRGYLGVVAKTRMNRAFQAKFGESDVVQQSITTAIEKFPDFRGSTSRELLGWARTILQNEFRQQQRELLSAKRNMFRERQLEGGGNSSAVRVPADDRFLTPGTGAVKTERAAAVSQAVSRLPADYQQVIRLRNVEQLGFAAIAQRMNRTENAVTKLWYRALIQLRKDLGASDV